MATFQFNIAMDIRAYGTVKADGATPEEARDLLTADFIADNFEPYGDDGDLDYTEPGNIWCDGSFWGDDETGGDLGPFHVHDGEWVQRDPVRDAAPDMLAALRKAIDDWPDWENDEPVNGGDMVEWFGNWRKLALAATAKAEGGKA